jgi:hypothetical protein
VHFKTLREGYDKGERSSNTYGFGFANRTIYTLNGGSSYLSSNNVSRTLHTHTPALMKEWMCTDL